MYINCYTDGPKISNISNQQDITEGNNLLVSTIVDANPVPKLVWWTKQNDANFRYDGFVLRITNINRKSSGNYSCYVMNTLAPSGMSEINITTQHTIFVNVVCKSKYGVFGEHFGTCLSYLYCGFIIISCIPNSVDFGS